MRTFPLEAWHGVKASSLLMKSGMIVEDGTMIGAGAVAHDWALAIGRRSAGSLKGSLTRHIGSLDGLLAIRLWVLRYLKGRV